MHAARRYLPGALHLNIDAESMTAYRLIELLIISQHPAEYLALKCPR